MASRSIVNVALMLGCVAPEAAAREPVAFHADEETPPPAVASPFAPSPLEGYAAWPSVRRGDELVLHVAGERPTCVVRWVRVGAAEEVAGEDTLDGLVPPRVRPDGVVRGADYPVAMRKRVPPTWAPGVWFARLIASPEADTAAAATAEIPFVVLPARREPAARIAVVVPFITAQAYNAWGGASLYPSRFGERSTRVSLLRPAAADGIGSMRVKLEPHVLAWMQREGFATRCIADVDLHADDAVLEGVELLVFLGHHEYWTRAMRQRVARFVGNGGHVLVLGGNTCYWQIRFEDPTTMHCAKDARTDAWLRDPPPGRERDVTTQWAWPPVADPEDATFGAAWRHAAWATSIDANWQPAGYPFGGAAGRYPLSDGYGGYRVAASRHWAFDGLDAAALARFGDEDVPYGGASVRAIAACGEVDGVNAERVGDRILVSRSSGAPPGLLVLATAPAEEGTAAVTIHHAPGTVVNVGSTGWPNMMGHTAGRFASIETFTRNVLARLSAPRRNALVNGGLEDWDGPSPIAWTAQGASPAAPLAECGTSAARLDPGGAIRRRATVTSRASCFVIACHAGGAGALRAGGRKIELPATETPRFACLPVQAGEDGAIDIEVASNGRPLVVDHVELVPLASARAASLAVNGRWTHEGGYRALLLVAACGAAPSRLPVVAELDRSATVLPAGSSGEWHAFEVRSRRHGAIADLAVERSSGPDAADAEVLVLPLGVPSPGLDDALDPVERALVTDAFDNGGFELAPTDAEIEAGRSFARFPPHWAVDPIGSVTFDRFAWRGARALRFDATDRAATAYSPAAELLPIDTHWRARAKAFVTAGATARFVLAASRVEDRNPAWTELASATAEATESWVDVELDVPSERLSAIDNELGVRAWLRIEVRGGKAWFDDIAIEVDAR